MMLHTYGIAQRQIDMYMQVEYTHFFAVCVRVLELPQCCIAMHCLQIDTRRRVATIYRIRQNSRGGKLSWLEQK